MFKKIIKNRLKTKRKKFLIKKGGRRNIRTYINQNSTKLTSFIRKNSKQSIFNVQSKKKSRKKINLIGGCGTCGGVCLP